MPIQGIASNILAGDIREKRERSIADQQRKQDAFGAGAMAGGMASNIGAGVVQGIEGMRNRFADPEQMFLIKEAAFSNPKDEDLKQLSKDVSLLLEARKNLEDNRGNPKEAKGARAAIRDIKGRIRRNTPGKDVLAAMIKRGDMKNVPVDDKNKHKERERLDNYFVKTRTDMASAIEANIKDARSTKNEVLNSENAEGRFEATAQLEVGKMQKALLFMIPRGSVSGLNKVNAISAEDFSPGGKVDEMIKGSILPKIEGATEDVSFSIKNAKTDDEKLSAVSKFFSTMTGLKGLMDPKALKGVIGDETISRYLEEMGFSKKEITPQMLNVMKDGVSNIYAGVDTVGAEDQIRKALKEPMEKLLGIEFPEKFWGRYDFDTLSAKINENVKDALLDSNNIRPKTDIGKMYSGLMPKGADDEGTKGFYLKEIKEGKGAYYALAFKYSMLGKLSGRTRENLTPRYKIVKGKRVIANKEGYDAAKGLIERLYSKDYNRVKLIYQGANAMSGIKPSKAPSQPIIFK